ncbi:MAG: metal-sensitive transcriptional regulator [bacterium]|jgi:DNA-binding FrmR family transcriptional regulator|nr:metal-sensitive transcriptional regulator [bacterium]MDD3805785.1 metal-sensitive transcriptional regulator [bacterium]MDD4153554.1 metal-sensitive transcriptional regulator [bacterium]MDD4557613.1 metal-sensitive transcriptional regulator [bacterium]
MAVNDKQDKGTAHGDNDLLARLRRIEGQVRGLQRMIEEGRDCEEIMVQFAATRAAFRKACISFINAQLDRCLEESLCHDKDPHQAVSSLVRNLSRLV